MTIFSVGDQIIIRFGQRHGQKGEICEIQLGNVYKVKGEDGSPLFFSGDGLEKEKARGKYVVCQGKEAQLGQEVVRR